MRVEKSNGYETVVALNYNYIHMKSCGVDLV